MQSLDFTRSNYDTCFYFKNVNSKSLLYMLLYVHDILLICKNDVSIKGIKRNLKHHFGMKDLGPAKKIVKIVRKIRLCCFPNLIDYMLMVIQKFSYASIRPAHVPLDAHLELSKDSCPKTVVTIKNFTFCYGKHRCKKL